MLMVQRLIDTLNGRGADRLSADPDDPFGAVRTLRVELPRAEKFDFGAVPLEPGDRPGVWIAPKLTQDEIEMWSHGLIPLPAPTCWFEFILGGTRTGFYVRDAGAEWVMTRADRLTMRPEAPGVPLTVPLPHPLWAVDGTFYRMSLAETAAAGSDCFSVRVDAPPSIKLMEAEAPEEYRMTLQSAVLVIYLALMINSRSTERRHVPAAKQKYTEARKGITPEFSHTVIQIVPKEYGAAIAGTSGAGSPKRLHWVRSHLRRYDHQTSGSKWCPMLPGPNGETGCWAVMIPRHVKGRAELGEVDHEYRVMLTKETENA